MLQKLCGWLWELFGDQRGQDDPAAAGLGAAPAGDGGTGEPPADSGSGVDGGAGAAGQGGQPPISPKFGEFGDDPAIAAEKLFTAYTSLKGEHENFTKKSGLTEKNLSSLRQTLTTNGLKINEETGQLELIRQPTKERKLRFTEEHGKLFQQPVLEAIRNLVQDIFEEQYETREQTTNEKRQQMQRFVKEKEENEELMMGYFPQLDDKHPSFDQSFFDRATEIWWEMYGGHKLKQLSAALRAAQELKIIPQMIEKAKADGVKKGVEGKRILAPVGGGGTPPAGGGLRVLSREEYLALPSEKQVEYDKWRLEHPDKK